MLERLFPRVADNAYPGHRLAPWLLGLMTIKIAMGLNVMLNAPEVARSADGVPLETYGAPAAAAFAFMFVLVLAANLFADAVRDGFDPRVRVGRAAA